MDAMTKNAALSLSAGAALRWHVRRAWAAHAALWRALILGLSLAAVLGGWVLRPEWRALERESRGAEPVRPGYSSESWFLAHFASAATAPLSAAQTLSALATLAAQHGVQIDSVSQAPRQPRELPLQGVSLDMALSGTYPALRSFMAAAMQAHPQLGVESWSANLDSRSVRAEVHWVLLHLDDAALAQRLRRVQGEAPATDALRIERAALVSATPVRDLFSSVTYSAPALSKPRPAVTAAPVEIEKTPSVDMEFLGRMNMGGTDQAMGIVKGQSVLLKVGDEVAEGFKVQSFDDEALVLSHSVSGMRLKVSRRQTTQ